jgi:3-oxoadipate enol-lactonase
MPHLELPRVSLYYELDGSPDDPALLLIHSGIAQLRMWDAQIEALSREHFVIRFDARGFGRTVAQPGPYSDRGDALSLLDHVGVDTVTAVGCSRGGMIAIELAIDAPERIAGLVTIGATPPGHPTVEETPYEHELSEKFEAATGAEKLRLEADFWEVGPLRDPAALDAAFVATARELNVANLSHINEKHERLQLKPSAYDRLGEITVPTLVMVGEHDVSVVMPATESLLARIPDAQEYRFAEAAHLPNVEQPEEFEAVLLGWLTDHHL